MEKTMLTTRELAWQLGVSERTISRKCDQIIAAKQTGIVSMCGGKKINKDRFIAFFDAAKTPRRRQGTA